MLAMENGRQGSAGNSRASRCGKKDQKQRKADRISLWVNAFFYRLYN